MWIVRLYSRVLGQLGSDLRMGAFLAAANVALAIAAFAEPILFGRIIDVLTRSPQAGAAPITFGTLTPLLLAWVGFGLFSIGAGVLVALYADRLSHRRRLAVVANYFEHVLELPLAFHTSTHSGRVLKVMLEGSGAMSWLWLGFFREHMSAIIALVVLLPLTVFLNWRLGLLLDALGNVPVIQSFTRIEAETRSLRTIIHQLLQAQNPVLAWWALASVASRASATITVTAIFLTGTWLHLAGLASIGEIVTFMSMATMLIGRLEQAVSFINQLFMQAPKLREFFEILDTAPAVHDRPHAKNVERFGGEVAFEEVSFSYDGKRSAVQDVTFHVRQGETVALVGSTGSGKSTTLGLLHRAFDPQSGCIRIDGDDIRDISLASLRRNIGVVFQEPMLFARSIRENLQVGRPEASDAEMIQALERAQAIEFITRQADGLDTII